jgi:hypothetical protein
MLAEAGLDHVVHHLDEAVRRRGAPPPAAQVRISGEGEDVVSVFIVPPAP